MKAGFYITARVMWGCRGLDQIEKILLKNKFGDIILDNGEFTFTQMPWKIFKQENTRSIHMLKWSWQIQESGL